MDVHSFQQFKPGLKDAVAHYLHLFYITVLHWLVTLAHFLQTSRQGFRLQNLVALVKINLWTPLLGFKCQFSFEEHLNPIKTKAATALDSISRLSFDRIPTYQLSWLNLAPFRTSALDLTRALATVVRSIFRHYIRGGLAWVRSYLSWLGSFKDTTPCSVRAVTPSFPDVDLLKNNAIENMSFIGGYVQGSYGGTNVKDMALNETLRIGAYLKDYAKDHWKAATDTGSSMLEMVTDSVAFSLHGIVFLKNGLTDYVFDHGKAAVDTGSSLLVMMADAASFSMKGVFCLKSAPMAPTEYLWARFQVAVDFVLGMMIDGASSSAKGLLGFFNETISHLTWINSAANVSYSYIKPFSRVITTCVAPMQTIFRCLLDALAAFVDFSESLFQKMVNFCQDRMMTCLDFLVDRQLECAICMMVGLLVFKIHTVSRWREQAGEALQTVRNIFAALGYFLKAPVDTIIITGFVSVYLLLAVKGLIRFSLLDKLHLELIVRFNTIPGAWVTDLDEPLCKGLFKSTFQLQQPTTPTTFSSLPLNIRSRIYQLALTDKNGFKWDNRMKTLRSNLSPSLLRVSHDTRRSTLAIPFNVNKVHIDSGPGDLQPSVPKELQRHLLPQPQPCGREQLLGLLTSLRIPRAPTPPQPTLDPNMDNTDKTDNTSANPPPPAHLGTLLATSTTPWIVEIREPYTRIWAFDMHTIVSHLPLVPSLVINYTITIPPGPPRPLSKAQHLARQLAIAAQQGDRDARFRVYVEGLEHWEKAAMRGALGRGRAWDGVDGDEEGGAEREGAVFLCEGKTDLMKEVGKVEQAVEEMNTV